MFTVDSVVTSEFGVDTVAHRPVRRTTHGRNGMGVAMDAKCHSVISQPHSQVAAHLRTYAEVHAEAAAEGSTLSSALRQLRPCRHVISDRRAAHPCTPSPIWFSYKGLEWDG